MECPRVLVGCPVSDYHNYCTKDYLSTITNLIYPNYDILLVDNSKTNSFFKSLKKQEGINVIKSQYYENPRERIINSRNILRQHVLDKGYDYFFSLEQDVISPSKVLELLILHKKDIISGIYCGNIKVGNKLRILPLVYKFPPESRIEEANQLINASNLKELKEETGNSYLEMVKAYYTIEELEKERSPNMVHSCGLGCVLIHREVLEKVKFRYSEKYGGFDDVWFCEDAKKNNFEIYVDPKIKCKHLLKNRPWSWRDLLNK